MLRVGLVAAAILLISAASGPGDPYSIRANGLGAPLAIISDPFGDFIVSDRDSNRVWWATTDGRKQVITREVPRPTGLGWDVFANLLIVGEHGVYKLNPQGKVSQLIVQDGLSDIALAPDGTLWVSDFGAPGDNQAPALRHYDAFGNPLSVVRLLLPSSGPDFIAVAPSGEVYFSTHGAAGGTTVYHLVGTQPQVIFNAPWTTYEIAIDANGDFYLPSANADAVYHYSRFGAPLDNPFASVSAATGLAFGRNSDGTMNKRLFAVRFDGTLVELNNSGVSNPGAPVGFATPAQIIRDLLRPGSTLSDTQRRIMDQVGNRNGRFDVGDVRAFLILNTTLSGSHAY